MVFNIEKGTYATNRKSIESVTIYKNPSKVKHCPFESIENGAKSPKTADSLLKLNQKAKSTIPKHSRTEEKPPLTKAASVLPGTTNLIMSGEFPSGTLRNSYISNFNSPMSNSTRSSLVRSKLLESKPPGRVVFPFKNERKDRKTRNLRSSGSANHSVMSLSTVCEKNNVKKNKLILKKPKVVLMAQVNLTREDPPEITKKTKIKYLTVSTKSKVKLTKQGSSPVLKQLPIKLNKSKKYLNASKNSKPTLI